MATRPNVDVVIPVHGQPLMAIRCVQSLRDQKRLGSILICDDGSDEPTQTALKNLDGVTVYRNPIPQGFISSTNRGVKKTEASYVLILNSDTEATPGAIEAMANNLDAGAAVCGALLLYPQNHPDPYRRGRVQHAGIFFEVDGFPMHFMALAQPKNKAVNTWRSVNAVTGACMMVRREVWDKVGGFDTKFGMGVFDDVSLCLSVKKLGLDVIYEPKAIVWHYEHASQPQSGGWFTQDNIQRNLATLFLKHGQPRHDIDIYCKTR